MLHIVGEPLRLLQKILCALDRLLQLRKRRIWQARQILRLVDQHLPLVLQRQDLIVDLLQLTRGSQHILGIVVGVEHHELRA